MAKKVASNPMVQKLAKAAAPHLMSAAQKYAPGLTSKVQSAVGTARALASNPMLQRAMAHPMGKAAIGAVRSRVGMGGMLALGNMSPGEQAYSEMRASGRRRRGGKMSLGDATGMAGQVLGAIPGAAEALGPFGALLGIEPPPPPPPRASFGAVRQGPQMSARPRGVGRGRRGRRGGFGFGDLMEFGKKAVGAVKSAASNPMLQQLARAAAPHAMAAAQKYAPGLLSKAQSAYSTAQKYAPLARAVAANPLQAAMSHPMGQAAMGRVRSLASNPLAQAAMAHPMGQAAIGALRARTGMGRRKRGPTAHSLAVGQVMKQTGMGLGQASKYVKENGLAY